MVVWADKLAVGRYLSVAIAVVAAVVMAGCGSSSPSRTAVSTSVAGGASICERTVFKSGYHSHTTPGSFVDHGPGSCPAADLAEVLSLVSRFRQAALSGGDICALLTSNERTNAQRAATETSRSCSQAALDEADATRRNLTLRPAQIRLIAIGTAPPEAGFVIFRNDPSQRPAAGENPLVLAIKKRTGAWQIDVIGYQF
jgi:hypothetical protein